MEQQNGKPDISKYLALIDDFVSRRMGGPEFQERYLSALKTEDQFYGSPIFDILNGLFIDTDFYVADPDLRTRPEDLSEEQLRERAREARQELSPYV